MGIESFFSFFVLCSFVFGWLLPLMPGQDQEILQSNTSKLSPATGSRASSIVPVPGEPHTVARRRVAPEEAVHLWREEVRRRQGGSQRQSDPA